MKPNRLDKYRDKRFLQGHHTRLAVKQGHPPKPRYIPTPEETPSGTCECGCGKPTNLSPDTWRKERHFKGYPLPYLSGHARRKRGANSHKWKGGRYITSGGYVMVRCLGHPAADKDGYVREHRLIMERIAGRPLLPSEHVHHVNGDTIDNRRKNLILLSARDHNLLHDKAGVMRRHLTPEISSAAGKKGAAAKWSKRIKST